MRATVEHSDVGLHSLVRLLAKHVGEVAIERPDGPVIDTALEAGLTVVVISPTRSKICGDATGRPATKTTVSMRLCSPTPCAPSADTLRTDRIRLRPLTHDSPATVTLRRACRARKDLVAHRVAIANQLREHLKRVFPGAVGLFADIDSPISLTFLSRFDCQDRADWLSPKRLAAWLASVGYCGRTDPAVLHARLTAAPRGVVGVQAITESHVTRAFWRFFRP